MSHTQTNKNPAFPDCPETKAYEALVLVIAGDPGLQAAGIDVWTWDGSADDLVEPTEAGMPVIVLRPGGDGTGWQSESEHYSNVAVSARLYVAGTCASDLLNAWGLFRRAMFPLAGTPRQLVVAGLMSPLVINGKLTRQAIDVKASPSGERNLVAEGSISLRINVNT